jgi:hypothetical protein
MWPFRETERDGVSRWVTRKRGRGGWGLTVVSGLGGDGSSEGFDLLLEAFDDGLQGLGLADEHADAGAVEGEGEADGLRELLGADEPDEDSVGGILHP